MSDRWQERAAQLWCLPQNANTEMDTVLAESIAAEFAAVEREAVAVERERCADYAENFITLLDLDWLREATKADCMKEVLTRCAAAIRGGG